MGKLMVVERVLVCPRLYRIGISTDLPLHAILREASLDDRVQATFRRLWEASADTIDQAVRAVETLYNVSLADARQRERIHREPKDGGV